MRRLRSPIALTLVLAGLALMALTAGRGQATVVAPAGATGTTTPITPVSENTPTTAITPPGNDGAGVAAADHGGIEFLYGATAAQRYKAIAGRRVGISCAAVTRTSTNLLSPSAPKFVTVTAPRQRGPIRSGLSGHADYCSLGLVSGRKETIQAIVPLTREGSLFLNQARDTHTILTVFYLPAQFIAAQEGNLLLSINGVALKREGPPLPRGKMGLYYRTGHLYIGTVDAAGVLIFARVDGSTIASNLLGLQGITLPGGYVGETIPLPKAKHA